MPSHGEECSNIQICSWYKIIWTHSLFDRIRDIYESLVLIQWDLYTYIRYSRTCRNPLYVEDMGYFLFNIFLSLDFVNALPKGHQVVCRWKRRSLHCSKTENECNCIIDSKLSKCVTIVGSQLRSFRCWARSASTPTGRENNRCYKLASRWRPLGPKSKRKSIEVPLYSRKNESQLYIQNVLVLSDRKRKL